jgi:hypothetical protein
MTSGIFFRAVAHPRPNITMSLRNRSLISGASISRVSALDPALPPLSLLRGKPPSLVRLLPRYPDTVAPILFHLPSRTIERVLEDFPPELIGPAFLHNGLSLFGIDDVMVKKQLPRWKGHSDKDVSLTLAQNLSKLILARADLVSVELLPKILEVTGLVTESNLLSNQTANDIVQRILPRCLEFKHLSRGDILAILSGVRRIPLTEESSVVFPMLSNFTVWYMQRQRLNQTRRKNRLLEGRKAASAIPEITTVKQIFD